MLIRAWLAFKFLLSMVLVAAPIALLVAAPRALVEPMFIGIAATLLFFAALPWVNFTTPSRSLGLVGIVLSLGIAVLSVQTAFGPVSLPRDCTGRRAVFREVENMLFAIGGEYLAAAPFALCSAFLFAGSLRMLFRARREA